jgi:hypothetical protein
MGSATQNAWGRARPPAPDDEPDPPEDGAPRRMEGATTTGGADMFRSSLFSLRNRILALIFFVLLPSLVLVIYTTSHERNREIAESRENVFHLARLASLEEQRLIEETRELLVVISGYRSIREHDAKNANRDLASLLSGFPRYTNFGVAGPDGLMWASALPMPRPVDISDRDYFQRAVLNKGLGIGGFQIGRVTGVPGINLGYPIFNDAGEIKNVVFPDGRRGPGPEPLAGWGGRRRPARPGVLAAHERAGPGGRLHPVH